MSADAIRVTVRGSMKGYITHAKRALETGGSVVLTGEALGMCKTVSCAEVLKRHWLSQLHQVRSLPDSAACQLSH